jgi:acetyl-CoA acetyltransferase
MKKAVIASGVRTPIGDFGGSLQTVKPLDLITNQYQDMELP